MFYVIYILSIYLKSRNRSRLYSKEKTCSKQNIMKFNSLNSRVKIRANGILYNKTPNKVLLLKKTFYAIELYFFRRRVWTFKNFNITSNLIFSTTDKRKNYSPAWRIFNFFGTYFSSISVALFWTQDL